jgi:hypothetical protein
VATIATTAKAAANGKAVAEIIELLVEHQDLANRAFRETAAHRFPGTLEEMKEATDD